MLFIGFSLQDDNSHRIADEVRRALGPATRNETTFGTALVLGHDQFLEELWQPDIECVPVGEADGASLAGNARELDIFLDLLCALTSERTGHLTDRTYTDVLSQGERELSDQLIEMELRLSDDAKATLAWQPVERLLATVRVAEMTLPLSR
jgi:hypothetical protein